MTDAPRARIASSVKAATSACVPSEERTCATSAATSSGWMPRWAYLVREAFSFSAADSQSRCRAVGLLGHLEVEGELFGVLAAQQQALQRAWTTLSDCVGDRHRDAGGLADRLVLAQQHVEDDAVDAGCRCRRR